MGAGEVVEALGHRTRVVVAEEGGEAGVEEGECQGKWVVGGAGRD